MNINTIALIAFSLSLNFGDDEYKNRQLSTQKTNFEEINFTVAQNSPNDQVKQQLQQARELGQTNPQEAAKYLDKAWNLAQTITDPNQRNPLLLQIITEYSSLGFDTTAIKLVNTIDYNEFLPDQTLGLRLNGEINIITGYLQKGDYQKAINYAENLESLGARAKGFLIIMNEYLSQNQIDDARAILAKIPIDYSYERYLAINAIVESYTKKGEYTAAFNYIQSLNTETQDTKNSVYSSFAELALNAQEYTIVEQCLQQIPEVSMVVYLSQKLIEAYVSIGKQQEAINVLNRAFTLDQKQETFQDYNWAKYFLLTKQDTKVEEMLVGKEGNDYDNAYVRYMIAMAYLQTGNLEKAWELTRSLPSDVILPLPEYRDPRDEQLDTIFNQVLPNNDYNFALKVALSYGKKPDQVRALQQIAQQQIKQNQIVEATTILDQAVTIAKTIDKIGVVPERHFSWIEPNADLLISLARDYITINQQSQALILLDLASQSAINFEDQFNFDIPVWTRTQTHLAIAIIYQELNEFERCQQMLALATEEANQLQNYPRYQAENLIAIAKIYTKINQPELAKQIQDQVLSIINTISDEITKKELLNMMNN